MFYALNYVHFYPLKLKIFQSNFEDQLKYLEESWKPKETCCHLLVGKTHKM